MLSTQQIIAEWTFIRSTPFPTALQSLLIPGEEVIACYATLRDTAIFTTKRLMVIDVQGMTGRKKEIYSIPYAAINLWSSENAGTFDLNSEITLWTRSGTIKINLQKGVDVRQLDHIIAQYVL